MADDERPLTEQPTLTKVPDDLRAESVVRRLVPEGGLEGVGLRELDDEPIVAEVRMWGSRRERTAPVTVDEFESDVSVYGVRGTAGNVRDWTSTAVVEGEGPEARVARIIRGGAWGIDRVRARCASRGIYGPLAVDDNVGFRWARSAPHSPSSPEQPTTATR